MKIKTSEASKNQLDWGLAKALKLKPSIGRNSLGAFVQYKKAGCDFFRAVKHTDPDLCVWLMSKIQIAQQASNEAWRVGASHGVVIEGCVSTKHYSFLGKTLAEAVARCVIAMKLGDEFECPDELGVV